MFLNTGLYKRTHAHTRTVLTAVVVMAAWEELKAQREGGEPLDLLGEAHRAVGSVRSVALPPLDGASGFHAALERGLGHQVEGQRLRLGGARGPAAAGVVRAVNVQVVIEVYLDGQISSCQPATKIKVSHHSAEKRSAWLWANGAEVIKRRGRKEADDRYPIITHCLKL